MKAAVFKEARKLVIEDVPDPEAGNGEVVVKVKNVGICGSDLHLYQYGYLPPDYIMGHEATGTIVSMGNDVVGWNEGDRVWLAGGAVCGTCDFCLEGIPELCRNPLSIGTGALPGAYAEYVKVPPRFMTRLPDEMGMREAALMDRTGPRCETVDVPENLDGQTGRRGGQVHRQVIHHPLGPLDELGRADDPSGPQAAEAVDFGQRV